MNAVTHADAVTALATFDRVVERTSLAVAKRFGTVSNANLDKIEDHANKAMIAAHGVSMDDIFSE